MGKSQAEAQAMIDDINHKHPKAKLIFISVDFGRLASVREAAEAIRKLEVPIDGFVGFPTVMAGPWMKTEDGIESHFQCNYLSNFLLINLVVHLMPAGSRVVIVCSSIRPEAPPPARVSAHSAGWEEISSTGRICSIDICQRSDGQVPGYHWLWTVNGHIFGQYWKHQTKPSDRCFARAGSFMAPKEKRVCVPNQMTPCI